MALIAYDPVGSQIYGSIFLPTITEPFDINYLENLAADLDDISADLVANYVFFGIITPIVRVTGGLTTAPFGSTPETRYKVGSFSHYPAVQISRFEDDTRIVTPIPYNSEFIVYELQTLQNARLIFNYPIEDIETYEILFDFNTPDTTSTNIFDPRTIDSGYQADRTGIGGLINPNPGYTVDVKLFYSLRIRGVDPTDTRDLQTVFI